MHSRSFYRGQPGGLASDQFTDPQPIVVADIGPQDVSELYRQHRVALTRLAILLVDDQASAEDVVQDAFMAFHRNPGRLRSPQAALAYLRVSVVNGSRSMLRRRRTARLHARELDPGFHDAADVDVLMAEEHRAVLTAVRTLPARQREVLVLRYWSDLTEAQIADAMGISRGAVKSAASRAIAKLDVILGSSR